jgi:hypothetical protein
MPWYKETIMSQKREFVRLAEISGTFSGVCRGFGISRKTGYKWLDRHRISGLTGLEERSRRPHSSPNKTCDATEDLGGSGGASGVGRAEAQTLARGSRSRGSSDSEYDHGDPSAAWENRFGGKSQKRTAAEVRVPPAERSLADGLQGTLPCR